MASSASASLQLEIMATGENSGTWGQKSNTNLQILEDAIAGTEAITLSSSDVTLTDTQFTFGQQSHAAILSLTGTLSGNVNIIVPTRSKPIWSKTTAPARSPSQSKPPLAVVSWWTKG